MTPLILILKELLIGYNKNIYPQIDASAKKGEMIALIGANGVGKSTLLKSMTAILPFRSGNIYINASDISTYTPRQLASQISYVPSQSPRSKNLTLFDMVASGCYNRTNWLGQITSQDKELINNTLSKVGLANFEYRDSSRLSDGEYQRAAIARSLVQLSNIILLDEPTAFLDIENRHSIIRLLKNLAENEDRTIIFSTHDLQQAIMFCDKIWLMGYNGFIEGIPNVLIENGAFDKIFKDSTLKFNKELNTFI